MKKEQYRDTDRKEQYKETDKMFDLISNNYSMLLVMSRFGIKLGFDDKTIGEVCRQSRVDTCTFLTAVNFLLEGRTTPVENVSKCLSVESLIVYLHSAHDYFLKFRLPHLRRKLTEAVADCPADVAFVIGKFFDEYVEEVNKHMRYEEKTVFPYVRKLLKGQKDPAYSIAIFRRRHDQIELKIIELKHLLLKYYPGEGSNLLNSVLFDIFATEQDLSTHNLIEDNLFIPAIAALEKTFPG
jgi:regulator of cell morphogenesis and NO signaling